MDFCINFFKKKKEKNKNGQKGCCFSIVYSSAIQVPLKHYAIMQRSVYIFPNGQH